MVLLLCANLGFGYLNLFGISKFENERKNYKDCGRSSKMTTHRANGLITILYFHYGSSCVFVLVPNYITLIFIHLALL